MKTVRVSFATRTVTKSSRIRVNQNLLRLPLCYRLTLGRGHITPVVCACNFACSWRCYARCKKARKEKHCNRLKNLLMLHYESPLDMLKFPARCRVLLTSKRIEVPAIPAQCRCRQRRYCIYERPDGRNHLNVSETDITQPPPPCQCISNYSQPRHQQPLTLRQLLRRVDINKHRLRITPIDCGECMAVLPAVDFAVVAG